MLPNHENSKAIFWKEGEPLKKGDKLVQANLAKSLEMIAENGPDEFYKGTIAEQIAHEMQKNGGLITKEDLAAYKAVERTPISGDYRGYQFTPCHRHPPVGFISCRSSIFWKTSI